MSHGKRHFDLGKGTPEAARADMNEELAFHVDERVRWLVARGWTPEAARDEAMRRLTKSEGMLVDSAVRKTSKLATREWLRDAADDVRYALRGLRRQPGFTLVAILTIAFGIGANTAMYSAIDALLLRALPFPEPGRLMDIVQTTDNNATQPWSYPKYRFYQENQRSFRSLALYSSTQAILTGNDPERLAVEEVTAPYLSTLGVNVAIGRDLPASFGDAPGAARVALISDALWQRRFAADSGIVGRSISIDNTPWEVAGVLPPGFQGLSGRAEVLLNLTSRNADDLNQEWSLEFSLVGRLNEGVAATTATREAELIGPRIYDAFPMKEGLLSTSERPQAWSATARSLDTIRAAPALRRSLLVLFGAVGLVLLIACVNLANLLVARALTRRREIAVRLAVGARRGRLVRLLITESLTLAVLGGIASLGVAWLGVRLIAGLNPSEVLRVQGLEGGIGAVGLEQTFLDSRALFFTLVVTLGVGLVFGLFPALRATRSDLVTDLKAGTRGGGQSRGLNTSRRALVVTEVALAVVLLTASGLMIRSLSRLLGVDPGFDSRNVLTLRLTVPEGNFAPDSMPGFYEQVQETIAAIPGVEHVGLSDCPPLNNGCNGTILTFADRPQTAAGNAMVGVHWASPDWFRTMRVPLKRGRLFTDDDRLGGPRVVLINESAARQFFPGEDAIGKRVAVYQGGFDKGAEIIGIVGDVRYGTIDSTARPDAYISYSQARIPRMMIFVRTTGDPSALAGTLREAIRRVAPTMPVYDVRPMSTRVAAARGQAQFSAVVLGLFAAVALTLAVMGIYGVMSFAVAQRTQEIGVRMALGAARRSVLLLIMRDTAWLAGSGLAIGVVAALAFGRVLRSMLFEVSPADPITFVGIVLILAATALLAGWIPALRAARVNPAGALQGG